MIRKASWSLAAVAAVLVLAATPAEAMCDGCLHEDHNVFVSDGEKFDLSEMNDGETRYFGSGDKEIRATRNGDEVVLSFGDTDAELKELTCNVSSDSCVIVTSDDDTNKVMIMKSRESDGESTHDIMLMHADEGSNHLAGFGHSVTVEVSEADDGAVFVAPHGKQLQWVSEGENMAGEAKIIRIDLEPSGSLLRCPEGDATLHLEQGESTDGYYCPKHNVLMEVQEASFGPQIHHGKKIQVHEE